MPFPGEALSQQAFSKIESPIALRGWLITSRLNALRRQSATKHNWWNVLALRTLSFLFGGHCRKQKEAIDLTLRWTIH